MPITHILWDFNGTLLDDAALALWCDNQILQGIGMAPIDIDTYRREMRMPLSDFYQALGVDLQRLPFSAINDQFLALFNANVGSVGLRENALSVIRRLSQNGLSQSVVSASYEPTVQAQAEALGLSPYMLRITGLLDDLAGHKHRRADFHLETLGLSPGEVLLVGDTLGDVHMARHLSSACVLMAGGHTDRQRLRQTGYPVVDDMEALYRYVMEGRSCTKDTENA